MLKFVSDTGGEFLKAFARTLGIAAAVVVISEYGRLQTKRAIAKQYPGLDDHLREYAEDLIQRHVRGSDGENS